MKTYDVGPFQSFQLGQSKSRRTSRRISQLLESAAKGLSKGIYSTYS